jgi:hypothetical protein
MDRDTCDTQRTNEIFHTRLRNIKESYGKAAMVAEDDYQLAKTNAAIERDSFIEEARLAREAADAKFLDQKEQYKELVKVAADAAETRFNIERIALNQEAKSTREVLDTQITNLKKHFEKSAEITADIFKLAEEKERYALMETAKSTRITADANFLNQKEQYERAAKVATEIAISRFDLERNTFLRDKLSISESYDIQLRNLNQQYVLNAAANANASLLTNEKDLLLVGKDEKTCKNHFSSPPKSFKNDILRLPSLGSPPEMLPIDVSNKKESTEEEQHDGKAKANLLRFEKEILSRLEAEQEKLQHRSSYRKNKIRGQRISTVNFEAHTRQKDGYKEAVSSDNLSQPSVTENI